MCERCEDLEEQVAYYKSELALGDDADRMATLRAGLRAMIPDRTAADYVPTTFVAALYAAKGRSLTTAQILDALPPRNGGVDDRGDSIVKVWVSRARKVLGHEAIETAWGRGYRLTRFGLDLVGRMVGDLQPIPEAQELRDRPPEELRSMAALIAGLLAHKDGDGGMETAKTYRRIADRLTGQPRVAA